LLSGAAKMFVSS